ncbi:hypothetical protein D9M68_1010590 [compost metagenome]
MLVGTGQVAVVADVEQGGEADPGPGGQFGQGHEGQRRQGDDPGGDLDQGGG